MTASASPVLPDLTVQLGRLSLPNPIMVASGTFGYANEMQEFVPLHRLGGIVPKTIRSPHEQEIVPGVRSRLPPGY